LGFPASGGPPCAPAIFLLSAKPNKTAEDRTIPQKSNRTTKKNQLISAGCNRKNQEILSALYPKKTAIQPNRPDCLSKNQPLGPFFVNIPLIRGRMVFYFFFFFLLSFFFFFFFLAIMASFLFSKAV
jgi:hypothetical protein